MNYIEFYYNRDKYKGEDSSDFLSHYGILGQKWGQRRWQNADGTFNEEGKIRYFGTGKFQKVEKIENEIGSIFNKKNVKWDDPKYNPFKEEEKKIWNEFEEQKTKNWSKDKKLLGELAGKKIKYIDEDYLLAEYYSNIKADIADKMKEKYSSINPNTFRMNMLHAEDEPFVSGYTDEMKNKIKELKEKQNKYPKRSAKWTIIESELSKISADEHLNQRKIEEELNNKVEEYINDHKDEILQDINRIRKNVDELGDSKKWVYYALEEHNGETSDSQNSKGLKDLSKDEWNDVKEKAEKMYNEDIKQQKEFEEWVAKRDAKLNQNDQKIGSTNNKTDKLLNSEKYKDLARNVGVDFLDPNDLASDNIKKDYKAVKNNINPFIVAMDDFAHGHDESAINYLNRFVFNKKEREILTKLCKKYGEKEKIVIEENNKKTEELIKNIEHNKNLKGNNISNEEYEKILNDTKSNNDLKKENARNVADIGLYKLNQMGNGGGDPGDDGSRTWFMYEDQTIGLPELTYLYYKGYSKNYIKQYVKNVNNKMNNMSYDDQDEYYENHPGTWQIQYADEYGYADDWIDTLFKN